MLVSGFMIPYERVHKCRPCDSVQTALDLMMDRRVSCLIIVLEDRPTGIVTKTDMCWCYRNGVSLDSQIGDIMPWTVGIKKIGSTENRDAAAKFFEREKVHHALVVDEEDREVGLISAMDVASEVARDARAWPWIRSEDGRVHRT
mmetsp:Transcript_17688/g.38325  ORF Transcript_17688/g.38325 Transcript_17688/m.38325 type:complete len:145 (+) Transcript_17688:123-557(+)